MKNLTLALNRSGPPILGPSLYIEGPESLAAKSPSDFASKLRTYLDDLDHLKYLDHLKFLASSDLTEAERGRLSTYERVSKDVLTDIKRSLGEFEDSLLGIQNLFENIQTVLEKPDVSHIQIDRPFHAVVVAAGPSLELELDHLRKVQSSALLVCVDAAFKTLLNEGITPHIVVAMERDDHSVPFFKGLRSPLESLLVCHATVKKVIFESYPGPIATALKYSGPFLWLPFERARFWTASSSAHLAYRLCAYWKPESIALVGQDLCFHPETYQSHARVPDYPDWEKASNVEERIQERKAYWAEGNTYPKVLTDPTWALFARDYQVIVDETKIKTMNTSRLGMKIGDLPYQPLNEWMKSISLDQKLRMKVPSRNPHYEKNERDLRNKLRAARGALFSLRKELQDLNEPQKIYAGLLSRPHFLELAFEVVFADWVRAENLLLNASDTEARAVQQSFLKRTEAAIARILELLPE